MDDNALAILESETAATEYQLDAVPVLDEETRVVGVVTARDITRAMADAPDQRQRIWQE